MCAKDKDKNNRVNTHRDAVMSVNFEWTKQWLWLVDSTYFLDCDKIFSLQVKWLSKTLV